MSASLNNIVDVSVQVSSVAAISSDFNLGMIIGNSNQKFAGTVRIYTSTNYQSQMVTDGFTATSAEYKMALVYFSQYPKSSRIAVGTAKTGDSAADTFKTLRAANDKWYAFCFAYDVEDSDIAAVAAVVEATETPTIFVFKTSDEKCITAGTTNIFKTLQAGKYTRTFGFYSSLSGTVDAAIVGLVSGLNSMRINSAYTAAYKTLSIAVPEDISDAQLEVMLGYGGNSYMIFGNTYAFTYPCISFGGYHIDEIFTIDAAKFLIQREVVAGLTSMRKVAQTESGVTTIASFVSKACNQLLDIGLIGGGIWRGESVGNLDYGDAISNGYYIQSGSIAEQSEADRAARKSPPILVALHASGAIEHVVVNVYVNR